MQQVAGLIHIRSNDPNVSQHLPPRKVLLLWQSVIDSSKKISQHRVIGGAGGSPQAPSFFDKPNINKKKEESDERGPEP